VFPKIKIPLYQPALDKEEEKAVIKLIRSKKLSRGPEIEQFEKDLTKFVCKNMP